MPDESGEVMVNTSKLNSWLGGAILAMCGWVLIAVIANSERTIKIETSVQYFNQSVAKIEAKMEKLVTQTELDLLATRLKNEQLQFQNEMLKVSQPKPITKN